MKRTLILLLLFIGLGGGAYFISQNKDTTSATSKNADGDFAVKNVDDIYKIFIANKKDYRVLLERKKDHWVYNKKFKARKYAIQDLLTTIENVEMKYTTPRNAEKNMIKNLASSGVKVEIYDKNDNIMKTYYVGASTKNSLGTYMIMEGATEPYVVHNPTFVGMLKGKYYKGEDDWKDLNFFGETVEEIEEVSVEYPKQRNNSFTIFKEGGEFQVKPFFESTPKSKKPLKSGAIENYLNNYYSLHAENFVNKLPTRDSIAQTVPFVILTLKNTEGETKSARLFPIIQKDEYGNPISFVNKNLASTEAISRYHLDYSDGSFRLVQHRVFERVFWAYNFFFEE